MKILVIAEHDNKNVKQSTYSCVTAASKIPGDIDLFVLGNDMNTVIEELKKCDHVKTIYYANSESYERQLAENLSPVISDFVKNNAYTHILTPSSTFGKNLSPKIATLLDVQQISDIISIESAEVFYRPIYAGNAIAKVKSNDSVKVITVRPTCFEPCKLESNVEAKEHKNTLGKNPNVDFIKYDQSKSDRPELTSAKIIISGGRGMQNGDNFKLLEGIADKLGAAMGASRAAVDAGFVPNDWQVGQTGKIVAPDLYIAVGISGAIQHIAGIKDSKVIACINKDEEAPIFKFSDYGLVADLFDVLPKLEEKL